MAATITGADFRVTPSAKDAAILAARVEARDRIAGPRVGDIIRFADGGEGRFTYHWGDGIQTTTRPNGGGSFYLAESGGLSYSGSLAESIPLARIVDTGEVGEGAAWFFHDDWRTAHNAVQVSIPCRIYREVP